MIRPTPLPRKAAMAGAAALVALSVLAGAIGAGPAIAQSAAQPPAATPPPVAARLQPKGSIEKLSGVWVEGPGFKITYGRTYEVCAQLCLDTRSCVMIEYYRPEKKCNLYDALRPRKAGGSSDVGIRR